MVFFFSSCQFMFLCIYYTLLFIFCVSTLIVRPIIIIVRNSFKDCVHNALQRHWTSFKINNETTTLWDRLSKSAFVWKIKSTYRFLCALHTSLNKRLNEMQDTNTDRSKTGYIEAYVWWFLLWLWLVLMFFCFSM